MLRLKSFLFSIVILLLFFTAQIIGMIIGVILSGLIIALQYLQKHIMLLDIDTWSLAAGGPSWFLITAIGGLFAGLSGAFCVNLFFEDYDKVFIRLIPYCGLTISAMGFLIPLFDTTSIMQWHALLGVLCTPIAFEQFIKKPIKKV